MTAANIEQIADQLSVLTVMEAANLAKLLEEKWGVTAAAAVAVAAAPGAAAGAAAEAQTEFTVNLVNAGDKKINVIKIVRELTGLGLGEAKTLTEAGGKILEAVDKAKAEDAKKKLEAEGAKVEIK